MKEINDYVLFLEKYYGYLIIEVLLYGILIGLPILNQL
jgi:hypothetical protein